MSEPDEPQEETPAPTRTRRVPGPLRAVAWMVAGAALAVVATLGAAAIALPLLEQRPELVADWLGGYLDRKVRIREMELAWQGSVPVVRLRELEIDTGDPASPTLAIAAAEVRVDPMGSLRAGTVRPRSVTVRGTDLRLERDPQGLVTLVGFGLESAARAEEILAAVMASLPAGAVLGLEETRVTLDGFLPASPESGAVVLSPVSLHLRTTREGLRLSGALAHPEMPTAALRFALRWRDGGSNPFEGGDLTINTRSLPLSSLPQGLLPPSLSGDLDLDVDGRLQGGIIVSMRGTAVLREALIETPHGRTHGEALESLLEFERADAGWTFTLLRLQARTGGELSSPSTVSISRTETDPEGHYAVDVDHAPVATLLEFARHAALEGPAGQLLGAVEPTGNARNLALRLARNAGVIRPLALNASLQDVVARSPDGSARLGPAELTLEVQPNSGRVTLIPTPVSLAGAPGDAITFAAGGTARWQASEGAVQVDSDAINLAAGTSRLHLAGSLVLPADDDASPWVSVTGQGSDFQAAQVKRYLAAVSLPETLKEWFEGAFHEGRVATLALEARGTLADLSGLGGTVRAEAGFEDAALEYEPGWPALQGLSGDLTLDGPRFGFRVTAGKVAGARIISASGEVADVTRADLRVAIKGRVRGLTEQGAGFLVKTAAGKRFAGLLEQLDARGKATLDLKLDIPLGRGRTRVNGVVKLSENTLKVGALRSDLEKVSGTLQFDREGLREGALEANYLGRRIKARMDGNGDRKDLTRLTIDGTTDPVSLVRHLYDVGALATVESKNLLLLSRLAGESRWQVIVDIADKEPLSGDGMALTIRSDLEGMALRLPAPLGKSLGERRSLEVRTRLTEAGPRRFSVRYGDDVAALLERDFTADRGFRLRRGELRFGGEPRLPDTEGLRVAGRVDLLSVDDWVALIADVAASAGDATGGSESTLNVVSEVAVRAKRLVALGAGFDNVRVRVTRGDAGALQVTAEGQSVDGTINIPMPVGSGAIEARFANLVVNPGSRVSSTDSNSDIRMDPRTLPEARVVAERLAYGDIELGLAKLIMRKSSTGVELSELFTLNDNFELRGSGSWTGKGADARSRLDLRIHSPDFGQLTRVLGYGDSGAEGGVSEISLEAGWQGTPFDFGLDRIKGILHFRTTEGRLLEVERGATGRVFGLLNVAVLPRRLLYLDFSDLFEEGIRYDLIEGSFRLDGGNAYSDNISMHTQSARIDLEGRVGLVAEDYDQIMTVTPKLSESLPLVPLWLAEKFLNRKLIDSAFAYRYIITGGWDDPKVERIRVKAERSEAG